VLYRGGASDDEKRAAKAALMQRMRAEYAALRAGPWKAYAGLDNWFEKANNASLGVLAAYTELVPAFERLFEREGRDPARFYAAVRRLASLPKDDRRAALADNRLRDAAGDAPARGIRVQPEEKPE
jgi:predicted aminopeptidase